MRRTRPHQQRQGVALIITLFMLALLTLLVVGFLSSMRTELRSSTAIYNVQETKMVAQGALAHAISLLRENIPDPEQLPDSLALKADEVGTGQANHWAINPGRLTLADGTTIPLHTGVGTDADPDLYADLNQPVPGAKDPLGGTIPPPAIAWPTDTNGDPVPLTETNRPPMRLAWTHVLEDPASPASDTNQVVGRHAFWIDDESARINFNIALGKPKTITTNPNSGTFTGINVPKFRVGDPWHSLGVPTSVNLDTVLDDLGLTDADKDKLLRAKYYNFELQGGVKIPEGVLGFLPPTVSETDAEAWFHRNKFNLTHYSRAPEINVFGRLRYLPAFGHVPLETSGPLQHPFFIERSDGDLVYHDYGAYHTGYTQPQYARKEAAVHNIYRYMTRRDWPGYEGASFVDKYGEAEAFQIALNIMACLPQVGINHGTHADPWGSSTSAAVLARFPSGIQPKTSPAQPNLRLTEEMAPEGFFWLNPYAPDSNFPSGYHEHLPHIRGPYITELKCNVEPELVETTTAGIKKYAFRVWWEAEVYLPPYSAGLQSGGHETTTPTEAQRRWRHLSIRTDYLGVRAESNDTDALAITQTSWAPKWLPSYPAPAGLPETWTMNGDEVGRTVRAGWHQRDLWGLRVPIDDSGVWKKIFLRSTNDPSDEPASQEVPNFEVRACPQIYVGREHNRRINNTATPADLALFVLDESKITAPNTLDDIQVDLGVRLRVGLSNNPKVPKQVVPHPYESDGELLTDGDDGSVFEFDFSFTAQELQTPTGKSYSFEVRGPMRGHFLEEWTATATGTMGSPNTGWLDEYNSAEFANTRALENYPFHHRYAPHVYARPTGFPAGQKLYPHGETALYYNPAFAHAGALAIIRNDLATKTSAGWSTLAFNDTPTHYNTEVAVSNTELPDFLLMDLLNTPYSAFIRADDNGVGPDSYSSITFMHSCAGRVNLNAKIYPQAPGVFQPPTRNRPLKAVFRYLRSDADIDALVTEIAANGTYLYTGDISKLSGYEGKPPSLASDQSPDTNPFSSRITDGEWAKDELLRNMHGCLTVNSNTFGVWGAAQKVKKTQANTSYGTFEPGDRVLGEKRFYALVERYLWAGRDGRVGNAHVDPSTGQWDRKADTPTVWHGTYSDHPGAIGGFLWGRGDWATTDVAPMTTTTYSLEDPQLGSVNMQGDSGRLPYTATSLENADNPVSPVVKYRVLYFKYLDE